MNQTNNEEKKEEKDLADKTIDAVENFINTTDHTSEHDKLDIMGYKNYAMFCYVPFVVILYLITGKYKKNKYMLFHSNQGLDITILWIVVILATNFMATNFRVQGLFTSRVPTIVSFINYVLYCTAFIYSGFGFINTLNGLSRELPWIGKFKLLK